MASLDLTHHFLIAMPGTADPHFAGTLTYVCEHNSDGALGIVVNRPTDMTMGALFKQINIDLESHDLAERPVMFGGPVQTDRGFVLHRPIGKWQSSLAVREGVSLTTSRDILEAFAAGDGPPEMIVSLGYAGWTAGQLEQEMASNAWLSVQADPQILFDAPFGERVDRALALLGIELGSLSEEAGHA
jgi:putative transcriptional regulator